MKTDWKKILPYLVGIAVFIGVAMTYCSPIFDGKVLQQGDVNNWKGAAQEAREHYAETGSRTWWTNSMFGGMPTYQITGSLPSGEIRNDMATIAHFGMNEEWEAIGILFAYFFGFFLMLRCFKVNPWLSIAGGLAIGLSTYFLLIIPAGHVTKAVALGFLAPVIGGFYAIFRKQYWLGAPLVTLYGILSITLHPQMTYYIFMLLGVMACAELYIHIREQRWKDLGISVGVVALSLLLVVGTKISWLEMNQSYLKETMRGRHSELTREGDDKSKPAGLDFDYATQWSYGKGETMTLLIPNWEGGSSHYKLDKNSAFYQTLVEEFDNHNEVSRRFRVDSEDSASQLNEHAPTFHGDKPFTSGPVYVGAIICFLFVLGLIIVPGPYKWALLAATLFSIFLAWGKNMTWLTEFFFNHFPMYNKFRAVESILVVAEITIPLLGFLALQRIVEQKVEWNKLRKHILIAGGITGGLCLFYALFGGTVDVTSAGDIDWLNYRLREFQIDKQKIIDALCAERTAMLKADAWRSFFFIVLGAGLVYWYAWKSQMQNTKQSKLNYTLCGILAVLVLADMLPVNKRFFGEDDYVTKEEANEIFEMLPYEEQILQDTSLNYRVLNMATDPFTDARTSYRLKSIGGYSAAKLRRYQDLIDEHISPELDGSDLMSIYNIYKSNQLPINLDQSLYIYLFLKDNKLSLWEKHKEKFNTNNLLFAYNSMQKMNPTQFIEERNRLLKDHLPVINMLNTKYLIVGKSSVLKNPYAMGNCWFVEDVKFVDTPDQESAALRTLDLRTQAVADKKFKDALKVQKPEGGDKKDKIELTSYAPNCLEYHAQTECNKVAVFSEIYYPEGWHLYLVDKNDNNAIEIPLARVNYMLRAAVIPAGTHKLRMVFEPHALKTDKWSMAILILALLLSAGSLTYPLWENKLKKGLTRLKR